MKQAKVSSSISFHSEGIPFLLKQKNLLRAWILGTIREEGKIPGTINFIFCNDNYLLKLNKDYLDHDTLTDIITFDYSLKENPKFSSHPELVEGPNLKSSNHPEPPSSSSGQVVEGKNSKPTNQQTNKSISGDIFISTDRIKENAIKFETTFDNELHRVMIHGILHLCGYSDKTKTAKKLMTEKEDFYLHQFEYQKK